ncbi:MAG: glycoside hydrolase family 97 protein [Candidatus Eisenbacteria bacterium]|nr:glycoside hydrolase family 97 protein [Candidatus Eisenbacteria bacterium]
MTIRAAAAPRARGFLLSLALAILVAAGGASALGEPPAASSPDGRIRFTLELDEGGRLFYRVLFDERVVIDRSRLGFVLRDAPPMNEGFHVENAAERSGEEAWEQPWGECRSIRAAFHELEVELMESAPPGRRMILTVRVFNDGLGFRFTWPAQPGLGRFALLDEGTEFVFPGDPAAWWIPAYAGNRYEYLYKRTRLSGLAADPLLRAVHTPLTLETEDGLLVALHEANLTDYAAMTLDPEPGSVLACDLVPWSDGDRVKAETPFRSPWRTIQIAESPADLAESSLILCLNEPCRIEDVSWIEPMKYVGIWWSLHIGKETWTTGPNHGGTTANTKRYIDFAAANGFGGVLVEGWNTGWDQGWLETGAFDFTTPTPDYDLEELARYAREKGVTLIGHLENGGDVAGFERRMEAAFAQCERLGIRAVKTGYVSQGQGIRRYDGAGREIAKEWQHGQYMVRQYRKAVEAAAKHRIMVCAHEPIKDTGIRRTWPNMMTREGARGQEYNAWSSGNPPEHTAILPFTRLLSAPMDFTPGIMDVLIEPYKPDNRVHTTVAKQLALYVTIYSPMQMAADLPENYEGNPAFGFIREVPVDWEETRFLNGAIGDYVTVARKERGGDDWYLGSLTDEDPRVLLVPLGFLDPGAAYTAYVYADAPGADYRGNPEALSITREKVNAETVMRIDLAPGGGQAIRFHKNR